VLMRDRRVRPLNDEAVAFGAIHLPDVVGLWSLAPLIRRDTPDLGLASAGPSSSLGEPRDARRPGL